MSITLLEQCNTRACYSHNVFLVEMCKFEKSVSVVLLYCHLSGNVENFTDSYESLESFGVYYTKTFFLHKFFFLHY